MDSIHHYYHWNQVPQNFRTKKQFLKRHRRLRRNASPLGKITLIFDKPRSKPKDDEAMPPEECQRLRKKLGVFGPDPSDHADLYRLERAGQLVTINLYDVQDTEEITAFTEPEATKLLEYMVWDGSHEDQYITEATVDGERRRTTWNSELSTPKLPSHLAGDRYFGVKKGRATMQVTVDCDRHSGKIPGEYHIVKTLLVGNILTERFPQYRWSPEINTKNGSTKFFGWLSESMPMHFAEQVGEQVRKVLQEELPQYEFDRLEIYPSNSPQVFAPLRADKVTVIDDGILGKVKKYRMEQVNGKRRRQYYDAHSCADFLNWIYFSDTHYYQPAFETVLREAVARCPDNPAEAVKPRPSKQRSRTKVVSGGMGDIGSLKGRCASTLVRFWSELDVPADDTIGKYITVTLRILKYEGLARDEAVTWVEDRLQALKYTKFSNRLTDNFEELQRVMTYAAEAVWTNNGYQKDPAQSEVKLKASVEAWCRRGFYLHDPDTWHQHQQAVVPELKLVWSADLLAVVPDLAALAHTTHEQVKIFLEKVLVFVETHNELAESVVGNLLEVSGIKGRSRQKQHDVRQFLVDQGLLYKQKNYYNDAATGYRHGNFYICGLQVTFEGVGSPPHTHVSIYYLSLEEDEVPISDEDLLELLMERRRLDCDSRHRERLRQSRPPLLRAA
jgi:hypothetical protein